jgi:hypothetical protein
VLYGFFHGGGLLLKQYITCGLDAGLIEWASVSAFDDDFISDYIFH